MIELEEVLSNLMEPISITGLRIAHKIGITPISVSRILSWFEKARQARKLSITVRKDLLSIFKQMMMEEPLAVRTKLV